MGKKKKILKTFKKTGGGSILLNTSPSVMSTFKDERGKTFKSGCEFRFMANRYDIQYAVARGVCEEGFLWVSYDNENEVRHFLSKAE